MATISYDSCQRELKQRCYFNNLEPKPQSRAIDLWLSRCYDPPSKCQHVPEIASNGAN